MLWFVLLLAFGIFWYFPRLAKTLVLGAVVLVGVWCAFVLVGVSYEAITGKDFGNVLSPGLHQTPPAPADVSEYRKFSATRQGSRQS